MIEKPIKVITLKYEDKDGNELCEEFSGDRAGYRVDGLVVYAYNNTPAVSRTLIVPVSRLISLLQVN